MDKNDALPAAVVLARLSSSRLPAKSLREIAGRPMIDIVIERLFACDALGPIVVATSSDSTDDLLADHLATLGVRCHRGSLTHVAERSAQAALEVDAHRFFRVNGDSPFVATELFAAATTIARTSGADLVSNVHPRVLPPGASVELIKTSALSTSLSEMSPHDAEHVTAYFYRNPGIFKLEKLPCSDYSFTKEIRLTVDDADDLARAEHVLTTMTRPHWEYGIQEVINLMSDTAP